MDLKGEIQAVAERMEIPLIGFAGVERWKTPLFEPWIPDSFHPDRIYPETRTVIVIGLPVSLPVLETAPSIWYAELYRTVNSLLDQYTYRIAEFLTEKGIPSVFVPRDGYGGIDVLLENPVSFFSHRHAAVLAGLGTFGVNNMVLTPQYGPRVRFGSILTTAGLSSDPLIEEPLCIRCGRCTSSCPAEALGDQVYPRELTDKQACTANSAALNRRHISPCGICIKVCPVGTDRRVFVRYNVEIYDDPDGFANHHAAWNHVRRYGGLHGP